MVLKEFTRPEANMILDLISRITVCSAPDDIRRIARDLKNVLHYDFAVCGYAKMEKNGCLTSYDIINISYPDEWLRVYSENKFHLIDPIVTEHFNRFEMQYWEHTFNRVTPSRSFITTARSFGLIDGYTYGMRSLTGREGSLLSIAGRRVKKDQYTEVVLQHVMPHLHQALHRSMNRSTGCRTAGPFLISPREKEVLNWVRLGKNSWDISVILGISERTVNYHVDNVKQKLDAVSRTQAVAIAIDKGLIGIE